MNFLIFIIVPLIVGLYAQAKVSSAYSRNTQIRSRRGITGREAARQVMSSAGIDDVDIIEIEGHLTDHYNPTNKTLALSRENYRGTSLAALGVAAHEAGHAIQHYESYAPLKTRMALVPITQLASSLLPMVIFGGFILLGGKSGMLCMEICIIIYLIMTIFQLVTLPVEYNASARAKARLQTLGILDKDEMYGVNETLDAAALTYVAAFVSSLGWLLYMLAGRRD